MGYGTPTYCNLPSWRLTLNSRKTTALPVQSQPSDDKRNTDVYYWYFHSIPHIQLGWHRLQQDKDNTLLGTSHIHCQSILTSQGLSTLFQSAWQTGLSWTLFMWWWNDNLSQSQLLPRVYQCIQQGADIHEVLKSWPVFLESQGMLGDCQPIMLPLLCRVIECEVALPKYGELINH